MDSSWISAAPAISVAFCFLILPGFLVVLAARVDFRTAVGLSGAVSASVLGVSAVVAPYLGLGWNVLTVLIGTLVAVLLTLLVRFLLDRAARTGRRHPAAAHHALGAHAVRSRGISRSVAIREATGAVAVALAACLIGWRLIQVFQLPGFISQTDRKSTRLNSSHWE